MYDKFRACSNKSVDRKLAVTERESAKEEARACLVGHEKLLEIWDSIHKNPMPLDELDATLEGWEKRNEEDRLKEKGAEASQGGHS